MKHQNHQASYFQELGIFNFVIQLYLPLGNPTHTVQIQPGRPKGQQQVDLGTYEYRRVFGGKQTLDLSFIGRYQDEGSRILDLPHYIAPETTESNNNLQC